MSLTALVSCNKDGEIKQDDFDAIGFKVLEYRPAPGQFINEDMDCKTQEEANAYAEKRITDGQYVSLGAFGGYIVVKMPKVINNRKDAYDFGIVGNAFEGSSEPGIVWVSEDVNGNLEADDPWYELKGGERVTRGYEVTYTRPSAAGDIPWTDNQGNSGVITYLPAFHDQMYYPDWVKEDSYTLKGSMLESRTVKENGIWKNQNYNWGYADNMGKDAAMKGSVYLYNQFDIDDAVDADGNSVKLERIHFVKVQSAVLGNVPLIGEVSTEVLGFKAF